MNKQEAYRIARKCLADHHNLEHFKGKMIPTFSVNGAQDAADAYNWLADNHGESGTSTKEVGKVVVDIAVSEPRFVPMEFIGAKLDSDEVPYAASVSHLVDLPDIPSHLAGEGCEVFLDGIKIEYCVAYDRPNNLAWRMKLYDDGNTILEKEDHVIEQVSGKIEVRIKSPK